ncbi:MAG TPA: hypothetical protein VJ302_29635 [Blastocatellia bacterium]|nr:hypothetical protein [Blastocatellia bacterium]
MSTHKNLSRRIGTSILALALSGWGVMNTAVTVGARDARDEVKIVGQLSATGSVTINGKTAISGSSVYTNSLIKVGCAKGNSAVINLGRMGRIELASGAQLTLRFSSGTISGDLSGGDITVKSSPGVKVAIATQDGVAASDGRDAAVLPVRAPQGGRGVRCVPLVVSSTTPTGAIGAGPLAAILAGAGGAAVIAAVAANNGDDNTASNTVP